MGFDNLKIFSVMAQIKQLLEESQITAGAAYFMLQSLTNEVGMLYNQAVQAEYEVQEKNNQKIQDEVGKKIEETPINLEFKQRVFDEDNNLVEDIGQE